MKLIDDEIPPFKTSSLAMLFLFRDAGGARTFQRWLGPSRRPIRSTKKTTTAVGIHVTTTINFSPGKANSTTIVDEVTLLK